MEKFEFTSPPEELRNEGLIREKFLKIPYPLSEEGEAFRKEVETGTARTEDIPTVENPRPELFKGLELSEEKLAEIFGEELSNIQVTKGCRHKCTFCAAGAAETVQTMPYPAIVKSAEQKHKAEEKMRQLVENYFKDLEEGTGCSIEEIRNIKNGKAGFSDETNLISKKAAEIFAKHPFLEIYRKLKPQAVAFFEKTVKDFGQPSTAGFIDAVPVDYKDIHFGSIFDRITNYYDSDPFDYKDRNFLHEDGSPADFGDVARLLATPVRPLHITTAGWSAMDKIAQIAAEKIAEMNRDCISDIRLSINQYEARVRKDSVTYLEDIKNSIRTLAKLGLQVILFDNTQDPKWTELLEKIKAYTKEFDLVYYTRARLSFYSGPMKSSVSDDDHHDVMACMPGYHIWPDGTVGKQSRSETDRSAAPKGSRPTPTDLKLWKK
ncbi:MAG: hypothetical protein AAB610_01015 [Patescibacteria group bacterium]